MTMPDERMRAVRWGGELLAQIASDGSLPDTTIESAKQIALIYPSPQLLEDRLHSGAAGLPPEWTAALYEALALFEKINCRIEGSARTRTELKYTLRHFPDRVTIRVMSRATRLEEWLW
jgi:hypothetical protein